MLGNHEFDNTICEWTRYAEILDSARWNWFKSIIKTPCKKCWRSKHYSSYVVQTYANIHHKWVYFHILRRIYIQIISTRVCKFKTLYFIYLFIYLFIYSII